MAPGCQFLQQTAPASVINWDDQGGKQAGRGPSLPQCLLPCVYLGMGVCAWVGGCARARACEEKKDKSRLKLPLKMMR